MKPAWVVLLVALISPCAGCATALVQTQLADSREDSLVVSYTVNEEPVWVTCHEGTAAVAAFERTVRVSARRIEVEGALDAWSLDSPSGPPVDDAERRLRAITPGAVVVFAHEDGSEESLVSEPAAWRRHRVGYARSRRWSLIRQLVGSSLVVPAFVTDVALSPLEAIGICILWATHPHERGP